VLHTVEVQPAGAPSNRSSSVRASSTEPGERTTVLLCVPCAKSAALSSVTVTVFASALAAPIDATAAATTAAATPRRALELLTIPAALPSWSSDR
jgi:hypothetical protein